jgi:hypothetical protein
MIANEMDVFRKRVRIDPTNRIRIFFDVDCDHVVAKFQCVTCDDLLFWLPEKSWWECTGCGQELVVDEAEVLLRTGSDLLRRKLTDVRKMRVSRWALVRWFRRMLGRGH